MAPDRRRAVKLLARNPDGLTEALLLANGIPVELVRAGLASAAAERIAMDPRTIEVARMRITEAGAQGAGGSEVINPSYGSVTLRPSRSGHGRAPARGRRCTPAPLTAFPQDATCSRMAQ